MYHMIFTCLVATATRFVDHSLKTAQHLCQASLMTAVEREIAPAATTFSSCEPGSGAGLPQLVGQVTGLERDSPSSPTGSNGNGRVRLRLHPQSDSKLHIKTNSHVDITVSPTSVSAISSTDSYTKSLPPTNKQAPIAQIAVASSTTCRRNLLKDFEKDLTFRPKLNEFSLRIVARNPRTSVPVVHRLFEVRDLAGREEGQHQEGHSFAPKLHPLSLKLVQERASKMSEVRSQNGVSPGLSFKETYSSSSFLSSGAG